MANESTTNNSELKDFFVAHGSKVAIALAVVIVIVVGVVQYGDYRKNAVDAQAESLGTGMTYLYAGEKDSALVEFESQMNAGKLEGIALAKAALYCANIKFERGDFDAAAPLFKKALDNAGSAVLVRAAAMHGSAAVSIEKGEFAAAATLLEKFVSEFGKRTGDLEDRYQKDEPVDETPMVPDALWKLTLVYDKMGKKDDAVKMAERIVKVYGDNQMFADKAKKFLAK